MLSISYDWVTHSGISFHPWVFLKCTRFLLDRLIRHITYQWDSRLGTFWIEHSLHRSYNIGIDKGLSFFVNFETTVTLKKKVGNSNKSRKKKQIKYISTCHIKVEWMKNDNNTLNIDIEYMDWFFLKTQTFLWERSPAFKIRWKIEPKHNTITVHLWTLEYAYFVYNITNLHGQIGPLLLNMFPFYVKWSMRLWQIIHSCFSRNTNFPHARYFQ